MVKITLNKAVALRILKLLEKNKMSLYRLEQNSGINHGTMSAIMQEKNKTVTLTTIYNLAKGFNISVLEFLNDPIFDEDKLNLF